MPNAPRCIFLGTDLRGSLRVAYGADGSRACWFGEEVFGDALAAQAGGDAATAQRLTRRYTGHTFEPQSGCYDCGARLYDPALARFASADSRHETPDPYAYCGNDPVDHTDPDGRGRHLVIVFAAYPGTEAGIVALVFDHRGAYITHARYLLEGDGSITRIPEPPKPGPSAAYLLYSHDSYAHDVTTWRVLEDADAPPGLRDLRDIWQWLAPDDWSSAEKKSIKRELVRKRGLIGRLKHRSRSASVAFAYVLGRKDRMLRNYIRHVGCGLGKWSALSLTREQMETAIALDEGALPRDPSASEARDMFRVLQPLAQYGGLEYEWLESIVYADRGVSDEARAYRTGYRLAKAAYLQLQREIRRRGSELGPADPDPHARQESSTDSDSSTESLPHEPSHGVGSQDFKWTEQGWQGRKPNYYGEDD